MRFLLLSIFISLSTVFISCGQNVECQQGINLLPMYGGVEKCEQQLRSDQEFLALCDEKDPDRAKVAIQMLDTGWYFLHQGDYDVAMKRINQAWLLDSTNVAIYASYVVVLDLTRKTDDAMKMLDLTLDKISNRENPKNSTQMNPSDETFFEFVVSNTSFAYKKTNNSGLGEYLLTKLETLNISESDKNRLKNKLKSGISQLIPN